MRALAILFLFAAALFAITPSIRPAFALCGPGIANDSWTFSSGATFTIKSTACPGTYPHHTVSSSRTSSNLVPQNSTYDNIDIDYVNPNTGVRVWVTFTTGLGVMPNDSRTYGPFSGDQIPNCGYTDFSITVTDTSPGAGDTHTLTADSYGQTSGICPI